MTALALIPARAGSKRCPGKNTADICGRPAIAWVLSAVKRAGIFDCVAVSTDDPFARKIAYAHDAVVIDRPPHLADDAARLVDVCRHAGVGHDLVCCIAATACLLEPEDLVISRAQFNHDVMLSAVLYEGPKGMRYLAATGTFVWMTRDWLHSEARDFYDTKSMGIMVMPALRGLDVDTPEDLTRLRFAKGIMDCAGTA